MTHRLALIYDLICYQTMIISLPLVVAAGVVNAAMFILRVTPLSPVITPIHVSPSHCYHGDTQFTYQCPE